MIRLGAILALARAELRLNRRLVRYWVFVGAATLLGLLQFANFVFIHWAFSPNSATAAAANPRFFASQFGWLFVATFLLGVIFLAFDVRGRDKRSRLVEVLDASPCSNLELVIGRAVGLLVAAWIPFVTTLALLVVAQFFLKPTLHLPSTLNVLTLLAVPAYVFTIGLVFLVTLAVRNRAIAAVVSLILVLGLIIGALFTRVAISPLGDVTGGFNASFPSDIVPRFTDFLPLTQRLGYLVMGIGLLIAAAAIHPRRDDGSRARRILAAAATFAVGFSLTAWTVVDNLGTLRDRALWRAAHEARRDDPVPDVLALRANADVDPGRKLDVEVDLRFRAPADRGLETVLFSLNPALRVREVTDGSGARVEFKHENGLLELRPARPLSAGEERSVHLAFDGRPDPAFAYLDSAKELLKMTLWHAQIGILGYEPMVFRSSHISLMPGVRWLPKSGVDVGRDDPRVHVEDFFDVDLTVTLPGAWLAAGPGRRQDAGPAPNGRARYRFAPPAPVPDVALVAGRYESLATEIGGVQLELLVDPHHAGNLRFFDDAEGEIHDWLAKHLEQAADVGFAYPYDALTMVEVPGELRGYTGGWRMESALAQPSMVLVREAGLPTARFSAAESRMAPSRDQEGGVPRAKVRLLETFFENDLNGGNPFLAVARSFFGFQTAGTGAEAVPLDYVWESLASELVAERRGFFSVHFFNREFSQEFGQAAQSMVNPDRVSDRYADVLIHQIVSRNDVWNAIREVSLRDLVPWENPKRTLNVLALKGGAMAESMLDDLGHETTGEFLGALRAANRGSTYDRQAVLDAGDQVGVDLSSWLGLWIDQTALPGFLLGDVRYYRIRDEAGTPRYQLRIVVRNGEPADGLIRLEYRVASQGGNAPRQRGEPISVPGRSAVEIGLVTSEPLSSVRIAPYLALNRDPFNVLLPELDAEKIVEEEPLTEARPVEWATPASDAIVVDDLDPGFSVEESDSRGMMRVVGRGGEADLDSGLPVAQDGGRGLRSAKWSRMTYADAYGRYRHTMAVVRGGSGRRVACFTAELPKSGSWELEYHVPGWKRSRSGVGPTPGTWRIVVEEGTTRHEASLDAAAAATGWNSLGRFDLGAGEVKVRVSDETDGKYVQADAIRFRPKSGPATGAGDLSASAH